MISSARWRGLLPLKSAMPYLRNNDLHRVLTVIEVGDHRDKGRYLTVLRRGGSSEDGEVAITGEVSRAPYPVHHTGTVDVGGVDVAEDVRF